MFLHKLPKELIKPFFDLAYTMANVDGDFAESEKAKLKLFATELNLDEVPKCDIVDYATTLDKFEGLEETVKQKVFFELLAMAKSDFTVTEEENELIAIAREKFGIDKSFETKLNEVIVELKQGYYKLAQIFKKF